MRPDVETFASFLVTRAENRNIDDSGKLPLGLMYLMGTVYMKRYLVADNLNTVV